MVPDSYSKTIVELASAGRRGPYMPCAAPLALAIALAAGIPSPICAKAIDRITSTEKPALTMLMPEDKEIQLALSAGPTQVRAAASVYVFGTQGYRLARSGTNGFTCLVNRDGNQAGDHDLKPTC